MTTFSFFLKTPKTLVFQPFFFQTLSTEHSLLPNTIKLLLYITKIITTTIWAPNFKYYWTFQNPTPKTYIILHTLKELHFHYHFSSPITITWLNSTQPRHQWTKYISTITSKPQLTQWKIKTLPLGSVLSYLCTNWNLPLSYFLSISHLSHSNFSLLRRANEKPKFSINFQALFRLMHAM